MLQHIHIPSLAFSLLLVSCGADGKKKEDGIKYQYNERETYRGHRATGTPGPLCRKRARRQAVGTAKELQDGEGKVGGRGGNERGHGNEQTRMGKRKWKENGLDERCHQKRRERNRRGEEREKRRLIIWSGELPAERGVWHWGCALHAPSSLRTLLAEENSCLDQTGPASLQPVGPSWVSPAEASRGRSGWPRVATRAAKQERLPSVPHLSLEAV